MVDAQTGLSAYLLDRNEMEESRNGSNTDNTICAREIFDQIQSHLENVANRGILWERLPDSMVTRATDDLSNVEAACRNNEGALQEHFISSVVFRLNEKENINVWELENVWDNVYICQLDNIGVKANYDWYTLNYNGPNDIQAAMAANMNIVLLRTITDWSHPDGNVWSQQIVWSGRFADCSRLLQPLEDTSNNPNSIQFRVQGFDLHPHLRHQYIACHGSHPVAAATAAVDSSPTVIISDELLARGDGDGDGLLCAICHDTLSSGEFAKQLPCKHVFHQNCIFMWFYSKLHCPLCRDEFPRLFPAL